MEETRQVLAAKFQLASSGIPPSLLVKVVITAAGGSAGPSR
jgi:hypothetical protein